MTSKKNPTDGKKDITHINTAYYAVKPKAIDLPKGTVEEFDSRDNEDDDDVVSMLSRTFGGDDKDGELKLNEEEMPGDVDEWTELDAKSCDIKIGDSLKILGNARNKCMSKDILSNMLGKDGDAVMDSVNEDREKKVQKEVRKLHMIYMSTLHFDRKMKERVENLQVGLGESLKGTYS